ncbi:MAG: DAK2 domain-containing protein [Caldisericaceae bacterium]
MNSLKYSDLEQFIRGAYSNLGKKRDIVNKLNVFPVPDGDTGTNMFLTVKTAVERLDQKKPKNMKELGKVVCEGALIGGRGNSGVILSQIFKGFFESLDNYDEIDAAKLAQAMLNGSKTAYQAVIKPVEGTMLTVMRSMAVKAATLADTEKDILKFTKLIIEEGKLSLAHTPELLPVLKEAGVIDAGGQGLIFLFEGGLSALEGGILDKTFEEEVESVSEELRGETLEYRYDTVLLTDSPKIDVDKLKDELGKFGDSTVVARANDLVKIHIHSNEPYKVLEYVMTFGPVKEARIEDMQIQEEAFVAASKESQQKVESHLPFSIVSIVQGDGFKKILQSLGVDQVVEGGQTMNPSINDILKAIESCTKNDVVVLPNNSNIILAAQEASKLSKKNVAVIRTDNVVQAIPVILSFNGVESFDDNVAHSKEVLINLHTVEVTYSVRSTKINGLKIANGDIIGLFDGEIVAKNKNAEQIVVDVFEKEKDKLKDAEFIGIYYGEDVKESDAQKLSELLNEAFPDLEIDVARGGQPYYYYLISIE